MASNRSAAAWWHALAVAVIAVVYFGYVLSWLGVDVSDASRYLLYLAVATFAPGVALAGGMWHRRIGLIRLVTVGAGLGYVLETYTFMALSALQLRSLWPAYPAVGVLALLWMAWRWSRAGRGPPVMLESGPAAIWATFLSAAVVVTVYTTYLAYMSSVQSHVALVPVGPDLFLHLSTAAEIKHHWPVTDPRLSGLAFSYHYLTHVHVAAASLLTGVELNVMFFRLYFVPLLALAVLNIVVLTRTFTRSALVTQTALFMVFFVGTIDVSFFSEPIMTALWKGDLPVFLGDPWVFPGNGFFSGISPSLVFGLAMFLPLVAETIALVEHGADSWRRWAIVGVLMAGSMVAKGSFMPALATGMVMAAAWLRYQRSDRWQTAGRIAALSVMVCTPLYFLFFYGYFQTEGPPSIEPFAIVKFTELWVRFEPVLRSLWQSGAVTGSADWTFRAIALATAAMVVVVYLVVSYGTRIAGIAAYVRRHRGRMPAGAVVILCLILASLAPSYLLSLIDGNQMHFLNTAYPLAGVIGAVGLSHLMFRRRASASQRAIQVLAVAMFVVSTWNSGYAFWTVYRNGRVADVIPGSPQVLKGSDAYAAQRWIRDHTPTSAVIAVSLFSEDNPGLGRRCDYSGLAERRVFLEGHHYLRGRDPEELAMRRRVLSAVFRNGDAAALQAMSEGFGVGYLITDASDGVPLKLPGEGLSLVYQNTTVSVYHVEGTAHVPGA